jgi:dipeptidyl aminopeptidase/acylaminoacyl peptidase
MKAATKFAGNLVLAVLGTATGALFAPTTATAALAAPAAPATQAAQAAPAAQAVLNLPSLVAYIRSGDVYVSRGAAETRLTTDGGYSRPRWSPDGTRLALLKGGQVWTMKADGSVRRRLSTRPAAGPSWSPDSTSIAFASLSCSGGPGVYQISAVTAAAQPQVLFPRDCRGEALPAVDPAARVTQTGSLNDRLRTDDAVAWSPDGTRVAFRGGMCESIYDSCLSVGTVATGGEKTVAAYGGGSLQNSGFAVVPNWRADGAKLAWTAYERGETTAENQPLHLVEYDTMTGAKRTVGTAGDREMAYVDATRGVVTGQYRGGSWVLVVNLSTGTRTPLHAGSQPSVQPTR